MKSEEKAEEKKSTENKAPKSYAVRLHAEGALLLVRAYRHGGGFRTEVHHTASGKKRERGLSQGHATFEAAKAAVSATVEKAKKAGWKQKERGLNLKRKDDLFSILPPPPKAGGRK
jgi:hypothetical protein